MSIPVTDNTHQAAFICLVADKTIIEKIALGLAGKVSFELPIGAAQNGPITHLWAATHATTEFSLKFATVLETGIAPQPISGDWSDYDVEEADVMPTISRMLISVVERGKDHVEQIDELLEDSGLVRIIPEIYASRVRQV